MSQRAKPKDEPDLCIPERTPDERLRQMNHGGQPLEQAAFRECSLAELLDDPLVGLVMQSDGVDRRTVARLFEQRRLQASAVGPDPACPT
jgi:hypothetical protein